MIYRTSQEKIDEYYQKTSLNQSSIKTIISRGVQTYLENQGAISGVEDTDLYYEEKEHFLIGSAVDCYLTQGEQCYLNRYYFSNVGKPGDSVMSIVKQTYDSVTSNNGFGIFQKLPNLSDFKAEIWAACNANNYYMNRRKDNWEDDGRIATVLKTKHAEDYFTCLREAGLRTVLSETQNMIINSILNTFTTHPFTSALFTDGPDEDIIYQLPIYFLCNGVYCKVLLDELKINHATKTMYPLDFKTMGDYITKFRHNFKTRRYDIQGSFYSEGVMSPEGKETISAIVGKDVSDYRVAKFAFVVESSKFPGTPLIFPMSESLLQVGRRGNADDLLGWEQGIDLYNIWSEKGFSLDAIHEDNKGVVFIDSDFSYRSKIF